jgi:hypothetical protein
MIASSPGYAVIVSEEISMMLGDTVDPACDCRRGGRIKPFALRQLTVAK